MPYTLLPYIPQRDNCIFFFFQSLPPCLSPMGQPRSPSWQKWTTRQCLAARRLWWCQVTMWFGGPGQVTCSTHTLVRTDHSLWAMFPSSAFCSVGHSFLVCPPCFLELSYSPDLVFVCLHPEYFGNQQLLPLLLWGYRTPVMKHIVPKAGSVIVQSSTLKSVHVFTFWAV